MRAVCILCGIVDRRPLDKKALGAASFSLLQSPKSPPVSAKILEQQGRSNATNEAERCPVHTGA